MHAGLQRRLSTWRSVQHDHRMFLGVLLLAATLRAVVVYTYRPAFFFTGDSVVYLENSVHLVPGTARPVGYAVLLRVILTTHNLMLVPVVQHTLGLVVATITYALLVHLGVARGIAVLGAVFVLFDPLQLVLEENILSESLFQILIVSSLALLVWNKRPVLWQCALVGLGLAASALTRNVGGVLILPVVAYALVRRFGWRRVVIILLAFVIPLLGYAGWYDKTNGEFALQGYSGRFLYGRVAPFARCAGLHLPSIDRTLCTATGLRSPWPTWYVFGPPSPFNEKPLASDPSVDRIAQSFAVQVILHQPIDYASAVTSDLLSFFKPARSTGPDADPINVDFVFRSDHLTAYPSPLISSWIRQADASRTENATIVHPLASALIFWQRWFYFPGPIFALALLGGFAGMVGRTRGHLRRLGAEGVLYSACSLLLLLAPVATVVFDYRFLVPVLPLLGTSGAIGLTVLLDHVARHRRNRGATDVRPEPATAQAGVERADSQGDGAWIVTRCAPSSASSLCVGLRAPQPNRVT